MPNDQPVVLPGAEPFSAPGGPAGALVLHGFTGCPQSMRGLAKAFAGAGFTVELPRLPGHGTSVDDMLTTNWLDWLGAADAAYVDLAARCERVIVSGLSMGGTLTLALAQRHPEIAGIVLINAAIDPADSAALRAGLQPLLDSGTAVMPAIGNDVADPTVTELAYDGVPVTGLLSLLDAFDEIRPRVGEIRCPALIFHSTQDHVVAPGSAVILADELAGDVELVTLERSFHVATLDYDKEDIEQQSVAFGRRVTTGPG